MTKTKCCLKYEKKGTNCKGCPIINLEEALKGTVKKKGKKKKEKKKNKEKQKAKGDKKSKKS